MHIKTNRLSLHRPTIEDATILQRLWKDEKVREYLGGTLPQQVIEDKIAALQNHWDHYGFGLCSVRIDTSESLIGLCGIHYTEDGLELSYLFFPEYWGQGLAREAAAACLNYGYAVLKHDLIISITQEENARSRHLLESIGMKCTHTFSRYDATQCLYKLT
jgi:[ribosomal protein S5]-alanine N-acetyltransferase